MKRFIIYDYDYDFFLIFHFFYFFAYAPPPLLLAWCSCVHVCVHIFFESIHLCICTRMDGTRIQYELTLVASDSLNENHTKIIISVRDVNDLPPVFPQKNYTYTMDEEIAAPFRFLQVKTLRKCLKFIYFFQFFSPLFPDFVYSIFRCCGCWCTEWKRKQLHYSHLCCWIFSIVKQRTVLLMYKIPETYCCK